MKRGKQQIIFIDGGNAKENYASYIDYLQKLEYNPYEKKPKKWKHFLEDNLGEDYEVLFLPLGNRDFSSYQEWKIVFEKIFPYLKENVLFIGHSLGGTFLVKYFNEENIFFPFVGLLLLAPAFYDREIETIGSFKFDTKLGQLQEFSEKITLLHSKDDPIVLYEDFLAFQKALPDAKFISFENKNHFIDTDFPEIVEIIKDITK